MRFFRGRSTETPATGAISGSVEPLQRRVVRPADPVAQTGATGLDGHQVGWIDSSLIEDVQKEASEPCPPRQAPGFRMTPSKAIQPVVAPKRVIPSKPTEAGGTAKDGTSPPRSQRTPRPSKEEIDRYVADLLADEESGLDEDLSRAGDGEQKDREICRTEPELEVAETEMEALEMKDEFPDPNLPDPEDAPVSRVLSRNPGRPSLAGANSDRVIERSAQSRPAASAPVAHAEDPPRHVPTDVQRAAAPVAAGTDHATQHLGREAVAQRRIWELDESEGCLGDEECEQPVAAHAATSPLVRTANALRRAVSRPLRDRISDPGSMTDTEAAPLRGDADVSRLRANQTEPLRPHPAAPAADRADLLSDARIEGIRAQGTAMPEAPADRPGRGLRPVRAAGRVKTRLLGFQHEDVSSKDLFNDSGQPEAPTGPVMFPVGWLVITAGEGRGASFALFNGVSHLGRGEDQAVQLDFGDTTISRQNHAAIAFDDELGSFFLGHGGKSNLVRLNGKPVLSTEPLNDGDTIRLGQTTLRFVALCGEKFSWVGERGGAHGHAAAE